MSPRARFGWMAVLFCAPVISAAVLYFGFRESAPTGRLNHGTLIEPLRPVADLELLDVDGEIADHPWQGKWTLLHVGGGECDDTCTNRLVKTRQVRLALNQRRIRVQRVYLAPDAESLRQAVDRLTEGHPQLRVLRAREPAALKSRFDGADPGALYLVDPLGHWMMRFDGDIPSRHLHTDLKRLLRFSQVG